LELAAERSYSGGDSSDAMADEDGCPPPRRIRRLWGPKTYEQEPARHTGLLINSQVVHRFFFLLHSLFDVKSKRMMGGCLLLKEFGAPIVGEP
jgi:hypothetical protein